MSKQKKP